MGEGRRRPSIAVLANLPRSSGSPVRLSMRSLDEPSQRSSADSVSQLAAGWLSKPGVSRVCLPPIGAPLCRSFSACQRLFRLSAIHSGSRLVLMVEGHHA